MFRRETVPAQAVHPIAVEPVLERREKPPAAESQIYVGGRTFAERKATAEATKAQLAQRRLASLGPPSSPKRNQRTGSVEYLAAELFYGVDKPIERFVQIDGVAGTHPIHSTSGKEDAVTTVAG